MTQIIFPHESLRPIQKELVNDIADALNSGKHILIHAPTGLGKTAAALAPALHFAMEKNLTIFFLTSRHTQHKIVLDTMRILKEKYNKPIPVSSIIGKKWMCAMEGASTMHTSDFVPYCKHLRENQQCEYFINAKSKTDPKAKVIVNELSNRSPIPIEEVIDECKEEKLCPYEISLDLAAKARVIIADYFYIFNSKIREGFLNKTRKELDKSIIIVDEGHNVPERMRELATKILTTRIIQRAVNEAKESKADDLILPLVQLLETLHKFSHDLKDDQEILITKEKFFEEVKKIIDPDSFVQQLNLIADMIREEKKQSSLGTVAEFIDQWPDGGKEFTRILSKKKDNVILMNKCLDPSLMTKEILSECKSIILMSGTLIPTEMYADILGFSSAIKKEYPSPFPAVNKLALIVPNTTTKFTMRNEEQYKTIAKTCAQIANTVPGNTAIFFPSYYLRDQVCNYFSELCNKSILLEQSEQTKEEKANLLNKFSSYKNTGAVLLGVAAGSFGEGIDLPGVIKCVIVVGLPLDRPNLETKSLIEYYDVKFGKGWDYGYTLPALTKTLQNAGRCIRNETDRGVLIFMDERYSWPRYKKCFPKDWALKTTMNYVEEIKVFFG